MDDVNSYLLTQNVAETSLCLHDHLFGRVQFKESF